MPMLLVQIWPADVDFVELQDEARRVGVPLVAPQVAAEEFIRLKMRDADSAVGKIRGSAKDLGTLIGRELAAYPEPARIADAVRETMVRYLADAGITVASTPRDLDVATLIDRAVRWIPPFEEDDKGFKDTIIFLTIIAHTREQGLTRAMFVTEDKVFQKQQTQRGFRAAGLQVEVAKQVAEAKESLKAQLREADVKLLEEEQARVKAFLTSRFAEISAFVMANKNTTERFVRGSWFRPEEQLPLGVVPRRVGDVHPREVGDVLPGLAVGKLDLPPGFEPLTFSVVVELDLVVDRFGMEGGMHINSVGEVVFTAPAPLSREAELTVKRHITVEAGILEENGKYVDLKLIRATW